MNRHDVPLEGPAPDAPAPVQVEGLHFADLHLLAPLLRAVQDEGYARPTPIQAQAIPHVLDGRDLLGCAQTGTGKTAAFALPILQRLLLTPPPPPLSAPESAHGNGPRRGLHGQVRPIRVLVLTPTRELCAQVCEAFTSYGRHSGIRNTAIFGGVGQGSQVAALRHGVDVVVATPGRLLDLHGQGMVRLGSVEILVLDESDRMLDMGFIPDIRRIVGFLPGQRQNLLFSATMPPDIRELANRILRDPVNVAVTPVASTVDTVAQHVFFVERENKKRLLEQLLADPAVTRVLVFSRTKHGANRLADQLTRSRIPADAIHGNKSQGARERALADFKSGRARVLVATDVAARGIDIDDVSHVVNFDLPDSPEMYVHRIGRTARAGASGTAWSLVGLAERAQLHDIERLIGKRLEVMSEHAFRSDISPPRPTVMAAASMGDPSRLNRPSGGGRRGGWRRRGLMR